MPMVFPKRRVNLRHSPIRQWLSRPTRTNRIRKIQCGVALCISQAQDARTSRGHNSQWKYRPLPPYGRAYCGPRGRSTKQPPPTNNQFGNDIPEHRQASPEYPATGPPGMPRARLAVRPPLKPHQSSIHATCTQLCTQDIMGIGGGATTTQ